jgi:hypothetical protein
MTESAVRNVCAAPTLGAVAITMANKQQMEVLTVLSKVRKGARVRKV